MISSCILMNIIISTNHIASYNIILPTISVLVTTFCSEKEFTIQILFCQSPVVKLQLYINYSYEHLINA